MKVLAINGSPRQEGNTSLLLRKVLEPISAAGIETEYLHIGGRAIRGCTACYKCFENRNSQCVISGDIVNDCIAKIVIADAVLLGTPTYFAGMTAEMKALVDRAGMVSVANGRLFARKIGAAVIAQRRGGATSVQESVNHMFLMSGMIVPGSTYWNFGVGRQPGEAAQDEEGLANMKDLGQTIAWLLQKLHAGS